MKFWTLPEIAENEPDELVWVLEPVLLIIETFQQGNEYPRLVRMGRNESDDDSYRYRVDVELAPGVVLPTECGFLELDEPDDDQDGETLARYLSEGLTACLAQMHVIDEVLHDTRVRVRKHIGGWTGAAHAARLIQVQLAPYDNWRGGAPEVQILVEGLGDRLEPEITVVRSNEYCSIEAELEEHRALFEKRVETRSRLARNGATGSIDELAVNTIAQFADVAEILRMFG